MLLEIQNCGDHPCKIWRKCSAICGRVNTTFLSESRQNCGGLRRWWSGLRGGWFEGWRDGSGRKGWYGMVVCRKMVQCVEGRCGV